LMAINADAMRDKRAESLGRRPSFAVPVSPGSQEKKFEGRRKHADACKIALERIVRDENQPRTEFDPDALERLAASLKARGQLQPCRVRWVEEIGHYVLVVGERRWRAAMMAGLDTLDCIVTEGPVSAEDLLEDQLVENALREDLKPVEQARSYRVLMSARGFTHRELAERLNVAHTTVTRALGLLDLPASVQEQVDDQEISPSTAYLIASTIEDPASQAEVAEQVVTKGLSREETVEVIRQATERKRARAGGDQTKGRGASKGKPKPVTSRLFKTTSGIRITAERSKGIEPALLLLAVEEVAAKLRAELEPAEQGGEPDIA
jgi:ParB family chromosome partitioning protein